MGKYPLFAYLIKLWIMAHIIIIDNQIFPVFIENYQKKEEYCQTSGIRFPLLLNVIFTQDLESLYCSYFGMSLSRFHAENLITPGVEISPLYRA